MLTACVEGVARRLVRDALAGPAGAGAEHEVERGSPLFYSYTGKSKGIGDKSCQYGE